MPNCPFEGTLQQPNMNKKIDTFKHSYTHLHTHLFTLYKPIIQKTITSIFPNKFSL